MANDRRLEADHLAVDAAAGRRAARHPSESERAVDEDRAADGADGGAPAVADDRGGAAADHRADDGAARDDAAALAAQPDPVRVRRRRQRRSGADVGRPAPARHRCRLRRSVPRLLPLKFPFANARRLLSFLC